MVLNAALHRIPARALPGAMLLVTLLLPPVAQRLEATLPGHVLVQIPLLALAGYWLGRALMTIHPNPLGEYNANGLPGVLAAGFAIAFWMLPRSLDAALSSPAMELAKLVSVPALIGLPLALSWSRLSGVARAFIWANLVSMLLVLGWLYLEAPVRLCNYYLVDQQPILGRAMLLLAAAITLFQSARAFIGRRPTHGAADMPLTRRAAR